MVSFLTAFSNREKAMMVKDNTIGIRIRGEKNGDDLRRKPTGSGLVANMRNCTREKEKVDSNSTALAIR